jgi:hypothetical protein
MSKGSNPKMVTTSTSAEPSDFIKPYYTQAIDTAQDLFEGSTPNYFPNATYVGFAPETQTALDLAKARAVAGNPLLNQAQTQASDILSGKYLSPTTNPYTQALYDKMAGDVTSQVESQFSKAGRFGSGANQEILARSLGELATDVYGDQYNRERELMANTMATAPALGAMDYDDIAKLQQVGLEKESLEEAIGANVPSNQLETTPYFRNTLGGLLQGAGMGVNLAGQIPQLSAGMGALGGGLLGAFL